jgi:hypothetical protein
MNLRRTAAVLGMAAAFAGAGADVQTVRTLTPEKIEAGRVEEGSPIEGTIRFLNPGPGTVTIQRVQTSCGCTTTHVEDTKVAPGDTAAIAYTIRTRGFRGIVRKTISVLFADPAASALNYTVEASVYSQIETEPGFLDFHSMRVNQDTVMVQILTVRNQGPKSLRITSIRPGHDMIAVSPSKKKIDPGKSAAFRVSVRPSRAITAEPTLIFETDSETKSKIEIPVLLYIEPKK